MPSNNKGKKRYGLGNTKKSFDFNLPSGEVCLMRRLGPDDMLRLGIIDKIDSLSSIIQVEHIDRANGKKPAASMIEKLDASTPEGQRAMLAIMKDETKWNALNDFVNMIVCAAVLEPLTMSKDDKNVLATAVMVEEVDLMDRMAIMTVAVSSMMSGVQAMEPFRQGSDQAVDNLEDGEELRDASEPAGSA